MFASRRGGRGSLKRPLALLTAMCLLACSAPASVYAAGSLEPGGSFNELVQREPQATKTQTTTRSTTESEGNSKAVLLIALGAAVVVLSGIAFVIARDARKVAPAGQEDLVEARAARDSAVALRRRRAKAKAARQQRKRNR